MSVNIANEPIFDAVLVQERRGVDAAGYETAVGSQQRDVVRAGLSSRPPATFSLNMRVFSSSVKSKMLRPRISLPRSTQDLAQGVVDFHCDGVLLSMSQKPSLEVSRMRRILRSLAASACSLRLRSVMSVKLMTAPTIAPSLRIGVAPYSTGRPVPSLRHRYSSSMRLDLAVLVGGEHGAFFLGVLAAVGTVVMKGGVGRLADEFLRR